MRGKIVIVLYVLVMLLGVATADGAERLHASQQRVAIKNSFVANLLKLHQLLLDKHPVTKKTRSGGYANFPDFYLEETYLFKDSDRVLSVVQHEKTNPENLHSLEVYLHDEHGRVIRDYSASYLPNARSAPVQTLISLHVYNGDYHAFRTFDAFGTRIYERCEQGDTIVMQFDEDAIEDILHGASSPANAEPYQSCFKNLAETASEYLIPR
jgi:hypothetical protein